MLGSGRGRRRRRGSPRGRRAQMRSWRWRWRGGATRGAGWVRGARWRRGTEVGGDFGGATWRRRRGGEGIRSSSVQASRRARRTRGRGRNERWMDGCACFLAAARRAVRLRDEPMRSPGPRGGEPRVRLLPP